MIELETLRGRLIVSVQADEGLPMASPEILAAVAKTVALENPAALRASLPKNIRAIKAVVSLPVIGIYKQVYDDSPVFITPTRKEAEAVVRSGAEIVALDATFRPRPRGETLQNLVAFLRDISDCSLMADISTFAEGMRAAEYGFDLIGTTLSGYTDETRERARSEEPDFDLLEHLAHEFPSSTHLIAEGRIWTPEQAVHAVELGAFAVVVGSAITRPNLITRRFVSLLHPGVERTPGCKKKQAVD
ncbi:N-acetylmannosamine-6-phosphate 2-epimerase [candidate division KSB1 bacterium]|nr:N-acetylmannosamine-6-phosphate 2-epimerase [candidate division KSB1 bacterium]